MRLYLRRQEEERIRKIENWILIYGRRKTGKTTLVKNNLKYETYVFITDFNTAIEDNRIVKIDDALNDVKEILRKGGIAIIDEFQRLPEVYWTLISTWAPSGVLIAS